MSTNIPIDGLPEAIRDRRRELGLNQQELADLAQVSRKFVYTVEDGKPSIRLDKLHDILDVLGLRLTVERRA
jgi:HTH-type transcriptional regulator/antitoxin HipB